MLEAINKQQGIFTSDDLNLLAFLGTLIGISLKNALTNDNLSLTQYKFKKFASVTFFLKYNLYILHFLHQFNIFF